VTGPTTPQVDVHIGDVSQSQLVFGDHNTIQTPKGTKVTVMQVGERPVPRLRAMPLAYRPAVAIEIVGRADELRLAAASTPEDPVQFYAPDGAGKTALLKALAQGKTARPEGVVFQATRRRTLDEIEAQLYAAFWETDVPYLPTPAEVGGFLTDRGALLVLDDCGLDRDDLDVFLESAPGCAVVIASEERTLWSRGRAHPLGGLDPSAALALLERELGRAMEPHERPPAAALIQRLDAHPQSLVEVAALIVDGTASFAQLADDPAAIGRRGDPSVLGDSQRRILEMLATLGDAPIGAERVAAVAGVPGAARELQELERRGWVKSASPRYRLLRPVSAEIAGPARDELADRLLAHLADWSEVAPPPSVADEWEAIEAALELGADRRQSEAALRLSLAAERKLAVAGSWRSWRHVLTSGLEAARARGDQAAEAHMLHQLGSRALCLGADQEAIAQLQQALGIRERLGDHEGAELTRHNLGQIGGGGAGNGGGGNGRGPWPRRLLLTFGALGLVAGAAVAVALATGGGGGEGAPGSSVVSQEQTTTNQGTQGQVSSGAVTDGGSQPTGTVSISITSPQGVTYDVGETVKASYSCTESDGTPAPSCVGSGANGPVKNGATIDTRTEGPQRFIVTAPDPAGNDHSRTVNYTVSSGETGTQDGTSTGDSTSSTSSTSSVPTTP
jgi:hypothetical protein